MKFKKIAACLSAASLTLTGCSGLPRERDLSYTDTLFDTVISVRIYDNADEDILKGCEALCKKYDSMFSNKIADSEISQINNAGGAPVEVSDDTIKLLKKGIYYGNMSNGAFDITIGTVSDLWDFKSETPSVPDAAAIAEAVSHVNYKNVIIKDNTVRLQDAQAKLDVGAIAKGFIADRLKEYLENNGITHALINLGGNVLAMGNKLDGSDYNIGIQKPFDESGTPITSVKIADKSIVTSGTYQRYFEQDGKIYHHILDARTGYPCENTLSSVTIITDSSLTADAMSTTCFLLGYDKAANMINQLDNVDAVFVTTDNKVIYSKNFQHK